MLASKEGTSLFARNQEAMKELVANRPGEPITIMTTGKEPDCRHTGRNRR